jgi:hypothetical protein
MTADANAPTAAGGGVPKQWTEARRQGWSFVMSETASVVKLLWRFVTDAVILGGTFNAGTWCTMQATENNKKEMHFILDKAISLSELTMACVTLN